MPSTIPKGQANFETSLASRISSSASSFTLNTSTDADGTTMSGTYAFTFDEGTSVEEHIIATMIGSAGTIVTRGVSRTDGATNVAAFQFAHDRGATVKSTNHPALIRIIRLLNGTDAFNSIALTGIASISGLTTPTAGETTKAANVQYVNDVSVAGASDATTTTKGIVEIATQAEVDAGTATGGTSASLAVRPPELANVIQDGSYIYAADSVGTDAYAITLVPAITAYVTGQMFNFKAGTANTGGATLAVNGLAAKTILKNNDQALITGDIESGQIVTVVYDGTNFQMQNPSAATMATALQGQLNTGYSANVTGTNLATLTAGASSDADALHTHTSISSLIDYVPNTSINSTYYTYVQSLINANYGGWTGSAYSSAGGVGGGSYSFSSAGTMQCNIIKAGNNIASGNATWANSKIIKIKWRGWLSAGANATGAGLVDNAGILYAASTSTSNNIRFVVDSDGTIWATNSNGTTNTRTSIAGFTASNWNTYEIIWTPTTSILFYVNGTLVATHTTNLPTAASDILFGAGQSNGAGGAVGMQPPIISLQN